MTNSLFQTTLILPAHAALSIADLLEGLDAPASLCVTAFEIPGTDDFTVQAIYDEAPSAEKLQLLITPLADALQIAVPPIAVAPVEQRDWVAQSLAGLPPINVGRFFIAGAHGLAQAPHAALRLHIEAGQAFGTGHHETTFSCLQALDYLARRTRFSRVLDLGCGTGVLAMAAAKLWRHAVHASDIDPLAVRIARENAVDNGLAAFIRPVTAVGFTHPAIAAGAPYDLILANILARPLMRLSYGMAGHIRPGGYIILSGLLQSQEAAVRSAYKIQGLFLARRFLRGDWATLLLHKPVLHQRQTRLI